MSTELLLVFHIFGVLLLFAGLATFWALYEADQPPRTSLRAFAGAVHGIGLFVILATGIGMASSFGLLTHPPGWIYGKFAIFILLGGSFGFVKRKPKSGFAIIGLWLLLGGFAAYLGVIKPF